MIQHTFNQIGPHVYWLSPDGTTDRPVLGVVAGTDRSLLIDTGNSAAHIHVLLDEIAKHNLATPAFAMLTHWHWDHVFGAASLRVPAFAHTETKRIVSVLAQLDWSDAALDQRVEEGSEIAFCRGMLKAELPDRSDRIIRPPDISFDTQITIDLGGVTCRLVHVGGDHAHDSSIAYIPEDKVMFLGDCLSFDLYNEPHRCTTAQIIPLYDRLLGFDAEQYLAGHNPEPLPRTEMIDDAKLFKAIGRTVTDYGPDRNAVLAALPDESGITLNEDHIEIADAFLEGLRKPIVDSVW